MPSLAHVLRELLEQEGTLLDEARARLHDCREPLVQGRVDDLAPLLAEQEALTAKLNEVEDLRRTVTGQLAKALGREGEGLTASQLARLLPPHEGEALQQAVTSVKAKVRDVKREQEAVQLLVTHHLDLLNQTLDAVHELAHQHSATPVYSAYGPQQEAAGSSRLNYGA